MKLDVQYDLTALPVTYCWHVDFEAPEQLLHAIKAFDPFQTFGVAQCGVCPPDASSQTYPIAENE